MNVQLDPNELLRAKYEKNYLSGRSNLLLVIIFTLISMVTFYFNGSYFLFSAYIPLLVFSVFAVLGWAASGDPEIAAEFDPNTIEFAEMIGEGTWLAIGFVIGVLMVSVYFICWLLSKKHPAALIVAAVFFGIDCLFVLLDFDVSMIMDILFHAWVMYYLVNAIVSKKKLNKLPPPVVETSFNEVNDPITVEAWTNNELTGNNNSEQN